jgi:hypothetical protein
MGFNAGLHAARAAALATLLAAAALAQPADSGNAAAVDSVFAVVNQPDGVAIGGLVIDRESGECPAQAHVRVFVDSQAVALDSAGSFAAQVLRRQYHVVRVEARGYSPFAATVATGPAKSNYFVTCALEKAAAEPPQPPAAQFAGPGWTIAGCIADSRLDLVIKSDSARLQFDERPVPLSKKGSFQVETKTGGAHTFHLTIPGYHEIYQNVILSVKDPDPFVVIHTTRLRDEVTRREITVSAKRQPLHVTATVAETKISRDELKGTAATTGDPIQALATLPSVATESDASARPIVRGGDVLESRAFLDGVTLLQPYHYGGLRSTLNQSALSNITIYKSGFPAEYPNAQSAIIAATSRMPCDEPLSLDFDVNLLQYSAYLGIPIGKNKPVGICASAQGSYEDFMTKGLMKGISYLSGNASMKDGVNEYINTVSLPDYQDLSLGMQIKPGDKLSLFVNEVYNTDWVNFTTRDSVETTVYQYAGGTRETGTRSWPADPNFYIGSGENDRFPDTGWDTSWSAGKGVTVDTIMAYKSYYNNLYGTLKYLLANDQVFSCTAAWQKRWWHLTFPRVFSDLFPTSRYDVSIDQYNLSGQWLYTGAQNHVIKAGLNIDYTKAKYNVFVPRILHQLITEGSTNFEDFWGPVTGDSGIRVADSGSNYLNASSIMSRLLVQYNGYRNYGSGGIFGQDEWTVSPRLTIDYGARIEASLADTSVTFSPRVDVKYSLQDNIELLGAIGHYTQNNYEIAALALSNSLKPEKVWHASVGTELRLLPWLTDKVDVYGKYYYDLISEEVMPLGVTSDRYTAFMDSSLRSHFGNAYIDSMQRAGAYDNLVTAFMLSGAEYESHYTNDGSGYSLGFENFLRYDPTSFWYGWLSFSLGTSVRQRHPGWRWYPFSLDRPLLISLVNYYRLPRKYEVAVKYRLMSGLPYTDVSYDNGLYVGASNAGRYDYYQRLDFRISKGFNLFSSRGNFYVEAWNAFNSPNSLLRDSRTQEIKMFDFNIPITVLFIGLNFSLK